MFWRQKTCLRYSKLTNLLTIGRPIYNLMKILSLSANVYRVGEAAVRWRIIVVSYKAH